MAFDREAWKKMTPDERFAVAGAGYSAEELPGALLIKHARDAWLTNPAIAERANEAIAAWSNAVAERYVKEGKDARRYKYFHALIGSSPPTDVQYEASPDLPGADSVVQKVRALSAEFGSADTAAA